MVVVVLFSAGVVSAYFPGRRARGDTPLLTGFIDLLGAMEMGICLFSDTHTPSFTAESLWEAGPAEGVRWPWIRPPAGEAGGERLGQAPPAGAGAGTAPIWEGDGDGHRDVVVVAEL